MLARAFAGEIFSIQAVLFLDPRGWLDHFLFMLASERRVYGELMMELCVM